MFPTRRKVAEKASYKEALGRNPLKSGQCFLHRRTPPNYPYRKGRRNPLKSGQCFLPPNFKIRRVTRLRRAKRRNPLKSGQCFLPGERLTTTDF